MFDIGWSELMLIGVVALVVIGPKDLPKAIYGVGRWVRKARVMAREFQGHIDEVMREAEMDDLRRQALKARDEYMGGRTVDEILDPKGDLKAALDLPPPGLDAAPAAPIQPAAAQSAATQPVGPQSVMTGPNIAAPETPVETPPEKPTSEKNA